MWSAAVLPPLSRLKPHLNCINHAQRLRYLVPSVFKQRDTFLEQFLQVPFAIVQKAPSDLHISEMLVFSLIDSSSVKRKYLCSWITNQDWRMARNYELRILVFAGYVVHQNQKRQLPLRRERSFGLIQKE